MNVPQIHLNSNDPKNVDVHRSQRKSKLPEPNSLAAFEKHIEKHRYIYEHRKFPKQSPKSRQSSPTPSKQPSQTASIASNSDTSDTNTMTQSNQSSPSTSSRMSMFFFRLHNLQREQENKRKKSAQQHRQRQRRGAKVFRSDSDTTGHLTLAPSRLFEKTPVKPSDSLDEIALQIPRYL